MIRNKIDEYLTDRTAHYEISKAEDRLDYIGNYKCHNNSLNYALKKPHKVDKILGCLQIFNDSTSVVHFVVRLNDGTILDPTYGRISSVAYSHLIVIQEYNIKGFHPNRELTNLKKYMYNQLPWYLRIFANVKDF